MHLTLKKEAPKPPGYNFLQQQEKFDQFIKVYNKERPHQAFAGRYASELYKLQRGIMSYQRIPIILITPGRYE